MTTEKELNQYLDFIIEWYDHHRYARGRTKLLNKLRKKFPYKGKGYRFLKLFMP